MPDLFTGTVLAAIDSPGTETAVNADAYSATATSYTTASTAGTYNQVAVVWVAPTTGRVLIKVAARMVNSGTGGTLVAAETRVGARIGEGDVVEAAGDETGGSHYGTTIGRSGIEHLLTGLTPGQIYNTRLLHRASSGTASIALRELTVAPAT